MESAIVWIAGFGFTGVIAIVWGTVVAVQTVSRDRTRREIMAYVAEGSISPEDAARLIEIAEQADLRKKILSDAAWSSSENYRRTLEQVWGKSPGADPKAC